MKSDQNIYGKGESQTATVYPLVTKNKLDNAFEKIQRSVHTGLDSL